MFWLIVILVPLMLILWYLLGLCALIEVDKQPISSLSSWLIPLLKKVDGPIVAAFIALCTATTVAVGGYIFKYGRGTFSDIVNDFYANLAMEGFSVAFTIFVIDRLYRLRAENEEKERLILQMGSPANAFALEAVRQLSKRGWLYDGTLNDRDFYRADLAKADLRKADLKQVDLSYANLIDSKFDYSNLREADLTNAKLINATFLDADMTEAHLQRANLTKAFFYNTNLNRATLFEAILCDADMRGAKNLKEATLIDAKYNGRTQWPKGFDPKAAEAIETEWNEELQEWIPVDAS